MSERVKNMERTELEGVPINAPGDKWVTWRCEAKIEGDHTYSSSWYFWFSTPIKKGKKKEIYFAYGHRLYLSAAEITFDSKGNIVKEKSLFTDMYTLNTMVEHTKKIIADFKDEEE